MRIMILFLVFVTSNCFLYAQNAVIDDNAINNWPHIYSQQISNDGQYAFYRLTSAATAGKNHEGDVFILKTSNGSPIWQRKGLRIANFSQNSHYLVAQTFTDSLLILDIAKRTVQHFGGVRTFKLSGSTSQETIAIQRSTGRLQIVDLTSNELASFNNVVNFGFNEFGTDLFFVQNNNDDPENPNTLFLIHLIDLKTISIWRGNFIDQITFKPADSQLAFVASKSTVDHTNAIWSFKKNNNGAVLWVSNSKDQLGDSVIIQNSPIEFLKDCTGIIFQVKIYNPINQNVKSKISPTIFNYKNYLEDSPELLTHPLHSPTSFLALCQSPRGRILKLTNDADAVWSLYNFEIGPNSQYPVALVTTNTTGRESYRIKTERPNIDLISLSDGSRKRIAEHVLSAYPRFSSSGKYVYWYDVAQRTYFTYNIAKGKLVNISKNISTRITDEDFDFPATSSNNYGVGGWLKNDSAILVYGRYDIWQLDPDGLKKPVCLTEGFGRKNRISLRITDCFNATSPNGKSYLPPIEINRPLLLCGFDTRLKNNGFFKLNSCKPAHPEQLIMSKGCYYFPSGTLSGLTGFPNSIIKAKFAEVYLLNKMSFASFPNVISTVDFKTFTPISAYHPQEKYKWMTAAPIKWKTFSGKEADGIMYRPSDFDSKKKYPVIFYFYSRLSPGLNLFKDPGFTDGPINIPWFVSRDYIICCVDIRFTIGEPASSVYNYVVSAANSVAKKNWVDSKRMAIAGHSLGGYEVNCLITKTKLFAAAFAAAGASDLISLYGLEGFSNCSGPAFVEQNSYRMGKSIWESTQSYIRNSPIFYVNKVSTPVLLFNNPKDTQVPWEQGVEFFTALRRLNKPAWLLEYNNSYHSLIDEDAVDFTKKLTEFFDYYLKAGTKPYWMESKNPS